MTFKVIDGTKKFSGGNDDEVVQYYEYRDKAGNAHVVYADDVDVNAAGSLVFFVVTDRGEFVIEAVASGHWINVAKYEEPKENEAR